MVRSRALERLVVATLAAFLVAALVLLWFASGISRRIRRLRDEAPLYYNEVHDFYAVSRYDDVERGLVDDYQALLAADRARLHGQYRQGHGRAAFAGRD